MAVPGHDPYLFSPSPSVPASHQPQYYFSPSATVLSSHSSPHVPTYNPDPLLVTHVRKQYFLWIFLRYSLVLPAELAPYIHPAEYAASVKRLNAAFTCRSWVLTFLVLALCFFFSGAVMLGLGAEQDNEDDSASTTSNTTLITSGGGNGTASATTQNNPYGHATLLDIGISFTVFSFACLMFTFRRWRLGRAKELTNIVLIENSRYQSRRPQVRFRLVVGGWLATLMQRSAPLRKWTLQVEVCSGPDGRTGGSGSMEGQQSGSSYAVVSLPHSNVVRLREAMHFPVRPQPNGPALVVSRESTQEVLPVPVRSVSLQVEEEQADDDDADDVSENPQQPPPAYSDIELQPAQQKHNQQQPTPPLSLQPLVIVTEPVQDVDAQPADSSSDAKSADWQPVVKPTEGDGSVVMLSSQAAVVDETKVKEYEEQLRRLVAERTLQDEKMQEMQRELENMRAQQQQPQMVIKLTDFTNSSDGVLRSLPPALVDQPPQQSNNRLAVHTDEQVEGSPGNSAAAAGGSRSGVVLLAGRRYSF